MSGTTFNTRPRDILHNESAQHIRRVESSLKPRKPILRVVPYGLQIWLGVGAPILKGCMHKRRPCHRGLNHNAPLLDSIHPLAARRSLAQTRLRNAALHVFEPYAGDL